MIESGFVLSVGYLAKLAWNQLVDELGEDEAIKLAKRAAEKAKKPGLTEEDTLAGVILHTLACAHHLGHDLDEILMSRLDMEAGNDGQA